jgi:hypothetical protein
MQWCGPDAVSRESQSPDLLPSLSCSVCAVAPLARGSEARAAVIPARLPFLVGGKYFIQMENTQFSESYRLGSTRILDYSIRVDAIVQLLLY